MQFTTIILVKQVVLGIMTILMMDFSNHGILVAVLLLIVLLAAAATTTAAGMVIGPDHKLSCPAIGYYDSLVLQV